MAVFEVGYLPVIVEACVSNSTLSRGMGVVLGTEQSADGKKTVELPGAVTDKHFGICLTDGIVSGDAVDVLRLGIGAILLNGTEATLSVPMVANTAGKLLASAPAAGANHFPIARLQQLGGADELVEAFVCPSQFQG